MPNCTPPSPLVSRSTGSPAVVVSVPDVSEDVLSVPAVSGGDGPAGALAAPTAVTSEQAMSSVAPTRPLFVNLIICMSPVGLRSDGQTICGWYFTDGSRANGGDSA